VAVQTEPEVRIGKPEVLFEARFARALPNLANYDVSPDGQRFVIVRDVEGDPGPSRLIVVLNWFEELERLVPTGA